MEQIQLLIIISTYNGKRSLPNVLHETRRVLMQAGFSYRFLLVDDGSRDGSQEVLLQLASKHEDVRALCFDRNIGQQENLRRGLREITEKPEMVLTMDDDGQHPPEMIPKMVQRCREGYDLVYGIPEWNFENRPRVIRRVGSWLRDVFFRETFRLPIDVKVSAYRVMTGTLAKRLSASTRNFFYLSAEAFQQHIEVCNVTYPYISRRVGESSYSLWKLVRLYSKIWYYYRWKKD